MRKLATLLATALLFTVGVACIGAPTDTRLCIRTTEGGPIAAGDTLTLMAGTVRRDGFGMDSGCVPQGVEGAKWSSSDPQVLTVSASGQVRAMSPGRASVTLTHAGKESSLPFHVVPPVAQLRITPERKRIQVGDTATFRVVALDSTGSEVPGVQLIIYGSDFDVARALVRNSRALPVFVAWAPGTTTVHAIMVHRSASATLEVVR